MAKATTKNKEVFTTGGNRADGTRFEAGDIVPLDLTPAERRAFEAMGTIGTESAETED